MMFLRVDITFSMDRMEKKYILESYIEFIEINFKKWILDCT